MTQQTPKSTSKDSPSTDRWLVQPTHYNTREGAPLLPWKYGPIDAAQLEQQSGRAYALVQCETALTPVHAHSLVFDYPWFDEWGEEAPLWNSRVGWSREFPDGRPKPLLPDQPFGECDACCGRGKIHMFGCRNQGVKFDADKLRYDLVPPEAMQELVKVLTYGAAKYDDNNWIKVIRERGPETYYAAAMRHIEAWRMCEVLDVDSELHHLAHAMCCLMFILQGEFTSDESD